MELRLKAFSIRDSKAEKFNPPFFLGQHGEAEREFTRLVNDCQSSVNQFPEDYDLYFLGEYDTKSGKLVTLETPQHMIKAVQVKRPVSIIEKVQ